MSIRHAALAALAPLAPLAAASLSLAQEPSQIKDVRVELRHPGPGGHGTFQFIAAEAGMPGKTVAGAPYSADSVTETVQILADGTRIVRKNTARLYRDSQGRTRDERTIEALGPWASSTGATRVITITDPVAKEIYVLNEKEKTADKIKMPDLSAAPKIAGERHFNVMTAPPPGALAGGVMVNQRVMIYRRDDNSANAKDEDLGKQTLEGLEVEGKRLTHTIPANEIGNDRPLVTTVEHWTSPALQVLVRGLTKDPQFGETSYRLANISRAEPAKSLFQIPSGYTIKEGPASGPIMFKRIEKKQ